jgi:hypothetical protein
MAMQVRHCLAAIRAIVDDKAETVTEIQLGGYFGSFEQEMAKKLVVIGTGFGNAWDRFLGDNQHVGGCFGVNVPKGKHEVVFVNNLGGDFAGGNLLKEGLAHGGGNSCGKPPRVNPAEGQMRLNDSEED